MAANRKKTMKALREEVADLFPKLLPLRDWQRAWAKKKLFTHDAFRCGTSAWCLECGGVFTPEESVLSSALDLGPSRCPCCGANIVVKNSRKQKQFEKHYFSLIDRKRGWQVVRHFFITRRSAKGQKTELSIYEVVQVWIHESGREVIVAKSLRGLTGYYDAWAFESPLRVVKSATSEHTSYDIWAEVCPRMKTTPTLKRNGFSRKAFDYMPPARLAKSLLTDIRVETLVKQGELGLLNLLFVRRHPGLYAGLAPSINICHRRGYKIQDAGMWVDHVELLRNFGYDIRNPRYICPGNLKKEHTALVERAERARRAAREEARRAEEARMALELEQATNEFAIRIAPYIGLRFTTETLSAFPLPTVEDFRKEGEAMHHCVFENAYYKRPESLIFSVRKDERRVATVEVNLKNFSVVQIRGPHNSIPEEEKTINQLFSSHMGEIQKIRKNELHC